MCYDSAEPPRELCGTFKITPPEIMNKQSYDFKIDSWALGFVLFELLSNEMPFIYEDKVQYLQSICHDEVDFDRYPIFKVISPAAKDLCLRLLEKDPDLRYSAKEALEHPWMMQKLTSESN